MSNKKRSLTLVTVRLFQDTFDAAKTAAKIRTEQEGRRVTYTDIVREWSEVGNTVTQFEMNPTDVEAARKLLHSNATVASAGAFKYFANQSNTAA